MPIQEKLEYGQDQFVKAEATSGIRNAEKAALANLAKLTREGFVELMTKNKLDAIVTPGVSVSTILAIGGFPGVIVPAGYDSDEKPFGLCFGGLKGSEPKLIEIAYGFEQAQRSGSLLNLFLKALLHHYNHEKIFVWKLIAIYMLQK